MLRFLSRWFWVPDGLSGWILAELNGYLLVVLSKGLLGCV
jgi:hypothetical protein